MDTIEKIKRYISNAGIPKDVISRYNLRYIELDALKPSFDTIVLAYEYGMAKGYRAAKAEMKQKNRQKPPEPVQGPTAF